MHSFIDFKKIKRLIDFPYPVEKAGWTSLYAGKNANSSPFSILEVCIRLGGKEKYSRDTIDGKTCLTPFPHVIYKHIGMRLVTSPFTSRESIHFSYAKETAEKLQAIHLLPPENMSLQPFEMNGEIETKILELRKLLTRSQDFSIADRIDLSCCGILEELKFLREWKERKEDPLPEAKMEKIASFIEANLCKSLSIKDIAKEFSLSERTLYRYWQMAYATSPGEYLRKCRLLRARELLENSVFSIHNIAKMFCFSTETSFAAAFKQQFGLTPRQCRKSAKFAGNN